MMSFHFTLAHTNKGFHLVFSFSGVRTEDNAFGQPFIEIYLPVDEENVMHKAHMEPKN